MENARRNWRRAFLSEVQLPRGWPYRWLVPRVGRRAVLVGGCVGVSAGGSFSGVSVGTGVLVAVRVGVLIRRVADGDGVGVAVLVALAVALGVRVTVGVFVGRYRRGSRRQRRRHGRGEGHYWRTTRGSARRRGVGVATRPGATATKAVAQMPSKASRLATKAQCPAPVGPVHPHQFFSRQAAGAGRVC